LFGELVAASHPDVQSFIDDYIVGDKPIGYNNILKAVGYEFSETKQVDAYYNGKLALKFDNPTHSFVFTDVERKNALRINDDDVLVSVNDTTVTDKNMEDIWERYFRRNTNYPELSIVVKRDGIEKTLTGVLFKGHFEAKNYLGPSENPDASQLKLRELWMNN